MSCHFTRFYYRANAAQSEYKALLTDAREGIPLNKEDFYRTDRIITDGLKKGQHIYHIMANSPQVTCSKSTVYRHFRKGYYSASVVMLPRAVKFKARKSRKGDYVPTGLKIGRSHDDFLAFIEDNHLECHVELDTVIGRIGGKVIMTVHFTSCNFMAGLLMDNKSAAEGALKFSALKSSLRNAGISPASLFPVLLCDNGGEFSDVFSFENDDVGNRELSLFFCDPMRSSQKAHLLTISPRKRSTSFSPMSILSVEPSTVAKLHSTCFLSFTVIMSHHSWASPALLQRVLFRLLFFLTVSLI